jgi:hypothetical protein
MLNIKLALVACVAALSIVACSSSDPTNEQEPAEGTSEALHQCTGPLPQLCQVCSDGTTACAHWVNDHGKCTVETCPTTTTCVDTVFCINGMHWDSKKCTCVK